MPHTALASTHAAICSLKDAKLRIMTEDLPSYSTLALLQMHFLLISAASFSIMFPLVLHNTLALPGNPHL